MILIPASKQNIPIKYGSVSSWKGREIKGVKRYPHSCSDYQPSKQLQAPTSHLFHPLKFERAEIRRFKFTGTKLREEFRYYFSEMNFLYKLAILLAFIPMVSRHTFHLYRTFWREFWCRNFALRVHLNERWQVLELLAWKMLHNSSRNLNQEGVLGSNNQHSKPDSTDRKLFIYHLFHQSFLCSFSSVLSIFTAAASFVFLSLGIWFREKSPTPLMNNRSSKICV